MGKEALNHSFGEKSPTKLKRRIAQIAVFTFLSSAMQIADADRPWSPPAPQKDCGIFPTSHIHNPERLIPNEIAPCQVDITGTVMSVRDPAGEQGDGPKDGDAYILVNLDEQYEYLLNEKNKEKTNGYLVLEVICREPNHDYCEGYQNQVEIPKAGDKIKFTGWWVTDRGKGINIWFVHIDSDGYGHKEIHPVYKLEIENLPRGTK